VPNDRAGCRTIADWAEDAEETYAEVPEERRLAEAAASPTQRDDGEVTDVSIVERELRGSRIIWCL
jgi:hypothetical protein